MSPEEKTEEGTPVVEGTPPAAKPDHPETVPWSQYVGIKESMGKKVADLEEQLKTAVKPEDHQKVQAELDELKPKFEAANQELTGIKERTLTEKREVLKSKGFTEDEVKDMSDEALSTAVKVLDKVKAKPDLGGGGGGNVDINARPKERIRSGFEALHPNKN